MLSFNGGGNKESARKSPVVDQRAQALEDKTKKADWDAGLAGAHPILIRLLFKRVWRQ